MSLVPLQLEYDLGRLAAFNKFDLDASAMLDRSLPYERREDRPAKADKLSAVDIRERYLRTVAQAGTQLIVAALLELPRTSDTFDTCAELPAPTTPLPREKPLPKDKPLTRWERFAKTRGIQKRKHRFAVDPATGEAVQRYGYRGAKRTLGEGTEAAAARAAEKRVPDDWAVPVRSTSDAFEDQYAALRKQKADRIGKQQKRERRNAEERAATEAGVHPKLARKLQLQRSLALTKTATASIGRFDRAIDGDVKIRGGKRARDAIASTAGNVSAEAARARKLLSGMAPNGMSAQLNVRKAVAQSEAVSAPPVSSKRRRR